MEFEPTVLNEAKLCDGCPCRSGQFVPGEGTRGCGTMVVGASPGERESATGIPFSGEAGQMVRGILDALSVDAFYTNVIKRPLDREPTRAECWKCGSHLIRELAYVQPRVVVALGWVATRFFLLGKSPMAAIRGLPIPVERHGWRGIVIPAFDPGFVMRRGGLFSKIGDEWIGDLEEAKRYEQA